MPSEPLYPIRDVAQITGVHAVTLRAWQRRYGLIKPARTPSGHRLYSDADVERIRHILTWLEKGVSIGQVKPLLDNPLQAAQHDAWRTIADELDTLACELKFSTLENRLRDLSKQYPVELYMDRILRPWRERLHQLDRPDQRLIEQSSSRLLGQVMDKLVTIRGKHRAGLIQAGQLDAVEIQLVRYELQELEWQGIDLGAIEAHELRLAEERLACDIFVVLPGTGLTQAWFKKQGGDWPDSTWFCGLLGRMYQQQGWLSKPYAPSIAEVLQQHGT